MTLNWLDVVILAIIALSSLFGLWRGFVREVLSLAAWIAAIVVARAYSPDVGPMLSAVTNSETAQYVAAFALLCLGTLIVGALINHFMARLIHFAGLQMTDRLLGSLFGILRGLLIAAILIYFAAGFYSNESWWLQSSAIPYIENIIEWLMDFFGLENSRSNVVGV